MNGSFCCDRGRLSSAPPDATRSSATPPFRTQLGWCEKEGIHQAIITPCGAEIVRDHAAAERQIGELGQERGLTARLAYDGMEVTIR